MAVLNNAQPPAIMQADNAVATAHILEAGTKEKDHVVENIEENRDATAKPAPAAGLKNYFVSGSHFFIFMANSRYSAGILLWHQVRLLSRCLVLSHVNCIRYHDAIDDRYLRYGRAVWRGQQSLIPPRPIGGILYRLLHPRNDNDSRRVPERDQQTVTALCLSVHREV
jgi:hypothetical protein